MEQLILNGSANLVTYSWIMMVNNMMNWSINAELGSLVTMMVYVGKWLLEDWKYPLSAVHTWK